MSNLVGSDLRIETMTLDDVELVLAMELRNYEYSWTTGVIRSCINADNECMKLLHKDEFVGYYVMQVAADEAQLLNICIDKPHQKKGYALQLLRYAMSSASQQQAAEMFLEVRPSNKRAIKLYEGIGFNEIGCRPNYYDAKQGREDALVMAMNLQVQDNG